MSDSLEEFLYSHMEKVDSTSRTWHSDISYIIKDEGHGSLDSNIFEGNQRQINRGSFLFLKGNGGDMTWRTRMELRAFTTAKLKRTTCQSTRTIVIKAIISMIWS